MMARELQARLPRSCGGLFSFTKGPFDTSTDEALLMYSSVKQGIIGDINAETPGIFDLAGKAKYNAWKSLQGMPCDDSRSQFVQHLLRVLRDFDEDLGRHYIDLIETVAA